MQLDYIVQFGWDLNVNNINLLMALKGLAFVYKDVIFIR